MGIRAIAPGPPVATVPNPVGPIHNFLQQHLEAVAHRIQRRREGSGLERNPITLHRILRQRSSCGTRSG
jgi:hypothetical protein